MYKFRGPLYDTPNDGGSGGGTGTQETGTPTFDDVLKSGHQIEFDRRVTKALETARQKWEQENQQKIEEAKQEAEKLAKMNVEQKAEYEKKQAEEALLKRERDITVRELRATAHEIVAEKGLPKELIELLDYTDADTCNKSITVVEKAFQAAVEKAVNDKLRGNGTPKSASGTSLTEKEQLEKKANDPKTPLAERVAIRQKLLKLQEES